MDIYSVKQRWKLMLFITAMAIAIGSLLYTNKLVNQLAEKEQEKVSIWADATRLLFESSQTETDLNFLFKVIEDNNTIPVILTDQDDKILGYRNLDANKASDPNYLEKQLKQMKKTHQPLIADLGNGTKNYIYYKESILLQQLTIYPYLQLFVILLFMIISYVAFSSSRKAEQNKVWLGLSRETAHQLGTPTSSLMAWVELLKDKIEDQSIVTELEKDVQRLNVITERFSKIGSQPKLQLTNLNEVVENMMGYMKTRLPKNVMLEFSANSHENFIPLNKNLFGWVIENLIKNSLDAMAAKGEIKVNVTREEGKVILDFTDNGKGIPKSSFKQIFKPGYTTKLRGWGLGLSLAKRIVEEYHKGRIFVLQSEINKGTTIRITLPGK